MAEMNDRIRELMLQAGYASPELAGRAITLAKLIVEECAEIGDGYDDESMANYGIRDVTTAGTDIRRHFGIDK